MRYVPLQYNSDFTRAYKRGKPYVHAYTVLYVNKNRLGHTRVGITASKKVGNAVARNRARRVLREALYQTLPQDVGGYDLVFVARALTARIKSTQAARATAKLLSAEGLVPKAQP